MTLPTSIIKGSVVVQGVPQEACFETFAQLLQSLGTYLSVEIAASAFSNVIVSNVQPGAADRGKLWLRLSNAGSPIGFYVYSATKWVQFAPAPNQVTWLFGDSANPPPGWILMPDDGQRISNADYAVLIAMAIPAGAGPYSYYPAIFVG